MDRIKILIILLFLLLTTNVIAKQTVPGDLVVLEDLIVSGDVYGTSYFGDGSNLTGISTEAVSSINVTGNDGITVSSDNTTSDANITLGLGSISPSGLTVSGDATFNGNINGISSSDVGLGNVTNNAQVYSASSPLYVTSGNVTIDTTNLSNVDTGWVLNGDTTTTYNVGIGSTNPRAKLSVMGITGADTIATFGIAGSTSVVVDKNGNVGIGTNAPAYKLAVHNAAGAVTFATDSSGWIRVIGGVGSNSISGSNFRLNANSDTYFGNSSSGSASRTILTGGNNAISSIDIRSTTGTGTTDYTKFTVGNNGATEAMRIVNSGNVGIGTTLPTSKFSVMAVSGSDTIATFGVAGSNSVVIDKNGNVGIGTSIPLSRLQISSPLAGTNASDVFGLYTSDGTLRTNISARGAQTWFLNNGSANVGKIAYSTPSNSPGIVLWTGSSGNLNRFDIVNIGTYLYLKYQADAAGSGLNIRAGGNIGIGTTTPGEKLQVDGNIYPKGGSYLSGDGTIGVTVTTCTGFKNGICISGT